MVEFNEQVVNIPFHADTTSAAGVVPFNVNTCKFGPFYVELDAMIFLENIQEMIEVFNPHIFHTKVIGN